jgi:hypothetical protein
MRRATFAVGLGAVLLAGCAGRTPVVVATADGSQRYEGERARGRPDSVRLTADSGADCAGDLHPTTEAETGEPASYGGVRCDDGRIGVLLFEGGSGAAGGAVSGVMNRRPVSGAWGSRGAEADA